MEVLSPRLSRAQPAPRPAEQRLTQARTQPPQQPAQPPSARPASGAAGPPPARQVSDSLSALGSSNMDEIGVGAPVHELAKLELPPGGVLGALERRDAEVFKQIAKELGRNWWVALDWGGPLNTWREMNEEGARAWPLMEPGKLIRADGVEVVGVSPSGKPRGDRFVQSNDPRLNDKKGQTLYPTLKVGPGRRRSLCGQSPSARCGTPASPCMFGEACSREWGEACSRSLRSQRSRRSPQSLHTALNQLGDAMAEPLKKEPRIGFAMAGRTHSLLACFPGGGAEYGAHFDGGNVRPRAWRGGGAWWALGRAARRERRARRAQRRSHSAATWAPAPC